MRCHQNTLNVEMQHRALRSSRICGERGEGSLSLPQGHSHPPLGKLGPQRTRQAVWTSGHSRWGVRGETRALSPGVKPLHTMSHLEVWEIAS